MRESTRRLLNREGWDVCVAMNGRDALARLSERIPSLILLDLIMPEMDGFDFIGRLRETSAWRNIPVVVLTAKDIDEREHARLHGSVAGILRKAACRRDELLQEVRQHVKACLQAQTTGAR